MELDHSGLISLGKMLAIGPELVFGFGICFDCRIMAIWVGDVPVLVFIAMARGATSKALSRDTLVRCLCGTGG
jgi:hypothetical protein